MSVQQIKSLLAVPDWAASDAKSTQYLNENTPTFKDLEILENLLQQARIKHEELQTQLSSSTEGIQNLISTTQSDTQQHLENSKELSLLRHSLSDELSELSNELTSVLHEGGKKPTLLQDIETLHRSLKELESVKGYVQVIQHGLKLSESAVAQAKEAVKITFSSVTIFQDLQQFVEKVTNNCSGVEDGNGQQKLHIVNFLERVRDRTWVDIKGALAGILTAAAEQLGWPMTVNYAVAPPSDRTAFENAFVNMLRLQKIGSTIGVEGDTDRSERDGLYPLQALVIPVSLRFKYHFEGSRQTNRLDKPEWYFTHILNVAHEHHQFLELAIQPLIIDFDYKQIKAWREFCLLLLPLLSRKLRKTIPALLSSPSVLAHTIYQALQFDASFTEEGFELQGTSAAVKDDETEKWDGISNLILGNQHWFQAWLAGEQKFVEDQYHDIINSPDAWGISDDTEDTSEVSVLKTTNSARRIKALFEQVTDSYSPLPNPSQRIHFLVSIQLPFLESYLNRISSSLDAFETLSSAFVRAVPGALSLAGKSENVVNVNTQSLTTGVEGVQRLCKALLSAARVELALETWAEDMFFLELWSDIHHNPALRERAIANPLLPQPGPEDTDVPNDTIFEVFINKYTNVIIRAENMIVHQVCTEVEGRLKAHFASTSPEDATDPMKETPLVSQTLLAPLTLLSSHLTLLLPTLSQTSFTTLYRRIASNLAEHILHRQILFRGSFSLQEGRTIQAECELWVETCLNAINSSGRGLPGGRQRIAAPWGKLLQAGNLAGADGEGWDCVIQSTFGGQADVEWEESMREVTGYCELPRDIVGRVLRRRNDCNI